MYKIQIEIYPLQFVNVEYNVLDEFRGIFKINKAIVSGGTIDMYPLLSEEKKRSVMLKIKTNHRNRVNLIK